MPTVLPDGRKRDVVFGILYFTTLLLALTTFMFCWNRRRFLMATEPPDLLLISIDGFAARYLNRNDSSYLNRMANSGIRADYMIPVFPSQTFPNHYSLVTGLIPSHHGIVGNVFYDTELQETFRYVDNSSHHEKWWKGEPIWHTAALHGYKTAVCMWPGSNVVRDGRLPDYLIQYNHSVTPDEKVDMILSWLDLPVSQRPKFMAMYFAEVDEAGHMYGPDSAEVNDAILKIDSALGKILKGISQRKMDNSLNVVIVSDHGMASVSSQRTIELDSFIDRKKVSVVDNFPLLSITPYNPQETPFIYEKMKKDADSHWHVFLSETDTQHGPYSQKARLGPIIAYPEVGWLFRNTSQPLDWNPKGMHGYSVAAEDMRSIFITKGPMIRSSKGRHTLETIQVIDVYNFLCRLLNIVPAPNDGRGLDVFSKWLQDPLTDRTG